MVPERFCTQIPLRMRSLLDAMEPLAREKDLLTSFALMAAMPVLIIPLERVAIKKEGGAANEINDVGAAPRFAADWQLKKREKFVSAFLPRREEWSKWRYLELPKKDIEHPREWKDRLGRHPMQAGAINELKSQSVENVLLVMRHGLAHGSVVYLDENGYESPFRKVTHLGFVTRSRSNLTENYRVLIVEEEAFLSFLKSWTDWISGYEIATTLASRESA